MFRVDFGIVHISNSNSTHLFIHGLILVPILNVVSNRKLKSEVIL